MSSSRMGHAEQQLREALAAAGFAAHPHGGPLFTAGHRPGCEEHLFVSVYLSAADAERLARLLKAQPPS